jgi:hypothetical protein
MRTIMKRYISAEENHAVAMKYDFTKMCSVTLQERTVLLTEERYEEVSVTLAYMS